MAFDGAIRINTEIDSAGAVNGISKIKSSLGGLSGAASIAGAALAGISIASFGKAALQSAGDIELATVKLETLLGSAKHAQKMIDDIVKMADVTPYGSNELIQAATTMKSFGISAKEIMPNLTALGNAAGGSAENLKGIALALSQTYAQGKMMGQDMLQFINAGIPILSLLGKQLGKTKGEIRKMIEEGKIGYKEVNGALQKFYTGNGKYAGLMAKAAQTLPGMFSTMQDSAMSFGRELVAVLTPALKSLMKSITDLFSNLSAWLKNLTPNQKEWLALVFKIIAAFVAFSAAMLALNGIMRIYSVLTAGAATATAALNTIIKITTLGTQNLGSAMKALKFVGIIGIIAGIIAAFYRLAQSILSAKAEVKGFNEEQNERYRGKYTSIASDYNNIKKGAEDLAQIHKKEKEYILAQAFGFIALAGNIAKAGKKSKDYQANMEKVQAIYSFLRRFGWNDLAPNVKKHIEDQIASLNKMRDSLEEIKEEEEKVFTVGAGGGAKESAGISRMRGDWEEYLKWYVEKNMGAMQVALRDERNAHIERQNAAADNKELLEAQEIMHQDKLRQIREEYSADHPQEIMLEDLGYSPDFAKKFEEFFQSPTEFVEKRFVDFYDNINVEAADGMGSLVDSMRKLGLNIPENIKKGMQEGAYWVVTGTKFLVESIANTFSAMMDIFSETLNIANYIAAFDAADMISRLTTWVNNITSFFTSELGSIPIFFNMGVKMIEDMLNGIMEKLPETIETFKNVLNNIVDYFINNAPRIIDQVLTIVLLLVNVLIKKMPDIFRALFQAFLQFIRTLTKLAPALIDSMMTAISEMIVYLGNNADVLVQAFAKLFLIVFEGLIRNLPQIIEALALASPLIAEALFVELPIALLERWPYITAALIKATIMAIPAFIRGIISGVYRAGKNIISALVSGITAAGNLWDKVKYYFNKFIKDFKDFFGIHSPSTLFYNFGLDIIAGLIKGILSADLSPILDYFKNLGKMIADRIKDGLGNPFAGLGLGGGGFPSIPGMPSMPSAPSIPKFRSLNDANPAMFSADSQNLMISNNVNSNIILDGRVVAQSVFKNIDSVVRRAWK